MFDIFMLVVIIAILVVLWIAYKENVEAKTVVNDLERIMNEKNNLKEEINELEVENHELKEQLDYLKSEQKVEAKTVFNPSPIEVYEPVVKKPVKTTQSIQSQPKHQTPRNTSIDLHSSNNNTILVQEVATDFSSGSKSSSYDCDSDSRSSSYDSGSSSSSYDSCSSSSSYDSGSSSYDSGGSW